MKMSKTGILKSKSKYEEKNFNLLVVGYQSKYFRDDIKALQLDGEQHLISNPFDSTCMISRYDVRAISDTPYEASSSVSINRFDGLSEAEKQAELLAEEERYYSLYRNEVEEEMYKEEQLKRESNSTLNIYNQVAFSYADQPFAEFGPRIESSATAQTTENDDESVFVPNEKLNLPSNIDIPPTVKLNQIIEKTAKFIASQGPQMEILLKTKQAGNEQFNFLNHDSKLNAYYKHILFMIKTKTYPWQEVVSSKNGNENISLDDTNSHENGNDFKKEADVKEEDNQNSFTNAIFIPKIQYKPSADCAYTQLISKITKAPISELERRKDEELADSKKIKVQALGLLQSYNSSSDDSDDNDECEKSLPPEAIQVTIDKTALYVAKNGTEFEKKLIDKKSQTFNFLNADNEFHAYYKTKVKENIATLNITVPPPAPIISQNQQQSIEAEKNTANVVKIPPPPICFSIKSKEEKIPLMKSKVNGSSDDELQQSHEKKEKVCNNLNYPASRCPSPPKISEIEEELERQVDIVNAEREEKLAKERLNDKLLISARERLGMLPKEKMLQIERKRKAMMFIINKNIKVSNGSSSSGENKTEGEIINLVNCDDSNDSSSTLNRNNSSKSSKSRRRSSSSSSTVSNSSSRSSDSSPRRKRSKKSHRKRKHHKTSKSRSNSRSRSRKHHRNRSRDRSYNSSSRKNR